MLPSQGWRRKHVGIHCSNMTPGASRSGSVSLHQSLTIMSCRSTESFSSIEELHHALQLNRGPDGPLVRGDNDVAHAVLGKMVEEGQERNLQLHATVQDYMSRLPALTPRPVSSVGSVCNQLLGHPVDGTVPTTTSVTELADLFLYEYSSLEVSVITHCSYPTAACQDLVDQLPEEILSAS